MIRTNCKYCEEFNGRLVCTIDVYKSNGCPGECDCDWFCRDFELKDSNKIANGKAFKECKRAFTQKVEDVK